MSDDMTRAARKLLGCFLKNCSQRISEESARKRLARQVFANGLGPRITAGCMIIGIHDAVKEKKSPLLKYPE
jgi:hypothetical protein